MTTVGFIGLGAMGGPMAANLARKGLAVHGFDMRAEALAELTAAGGRACASVAEAARGVGVLVLMVATPAQIEDVLDGGGLAALPAGATVVMHATVAPDFAARLGARLEAAGRPFLDAPVSGGQIGAQQGRLTIMASGTPAAFAAAEPVLAAYSQKVYRLGDAAGAGSTVKMINQHLAGVHIAAAAEAMALAARAGVAPAKVFEVISASAGRSWMFENRVPHILARDFTPLSAVEIFVKDLGIVLGTGGELRFPLPIAAAAHQQFLAAAAAGLGREDDSAVVKVYERLAGIEVKG
jgi:3-hydroxyisobutyrate dehydrogenase